MASSACKAVAEAGTMVKAAERLAVGFQVVVGDTPMLLNSLRERRLDAAMTRLPELDDTGDLEVQVLFYDPLVVAGGLRNRWINAIGSSSKT